MLNIQLFWREEMLHGHSQAPQQHQSQPWQGCTIMVTVCTDAEVTLEHARGERGWGQQRDSTGCCSRYTKIWISLAIALS